MPAHLAPSRRLLASVQHFTAPIPATPSDFRAAFSFVYEPQLSAERAAAAGGAPAPASASAGKDVGRDESANPAKVLDGLLLGLLGGLRGNGSSSGSAKQPAQVRGGVSYPEDDIAALNAAKRFLVKVRRGVAVLGWLWRQLWRQLCRTFHSMPIQRVCSRQCRATAPWSPLLSALTAATLRAMQAGVVNK